MMMKTGEGGDNFNLIQLIFSIRRCHMKLIHPNGATPKIFDNEKCTKQKRIIQS